MKMYRTMDNRALLVPKDWKVTDMEDDSILITRPDGWGIRGKNK